MAGEDPFAFLATEQPPKPLESSKSIRRLNWGGGQKTGTGDQKSKWREKLFSKDRDSKQAEATERQVDDFLGLNRPRALPELPVVPSIADTSFEPSISQRQELSTPPSPPKQHAALPTQASVPASPPKGKPRRRKGLRVTFNNLPPDVVGEGGDESEEPTVEISRRKNRVVKKEPEPQKDDQYEDIQHRRPTLPELHLDTSFANGAAPIAQAENTQTWKPLLISPQDQDFLMALNSGEPGSRLSLRASDDSRSFARRIHARMQAEEGLALQHRLPQEDPTSPTEADEDSERRQHDALPTRPSFTSQQSQLSQRSLTVDEGTPTLSLRTSPVPAVHEQIKAMRREDLPEILSPGGSSASSLSPTNDGSKPAIPTSETARTHAAQSAPPQYQPSPSSRPTADTPKKTSATPASRGAKMTLRSVANAMGDNAYQEFTQYVERFGSLYRLAAESVKPLMETSFAEWVRASTWWFLRGRSGLESAVRSGRSPETTEAMQAVVDLGKAWWIATQIVPAHPEVMRYGKMSIDALLAVVNTTGDHSMAGLLNLHQKILSHLRALTVSMKRNQIISAIGSHSQVNEHPVDTNIWVRYPFFAPDVAAIFQGSNRRSMLIDTSSQLSNTPEMMLVGDTSRYFSYATMFVEVSLAGDDDDDTPQYAIQCVISLRRDRSDWHVLATISSQSELVSITIQSDRKNGPTWDDVQWQVKARTMTVKLRRGYELNVAFQEKDFKMLWNIVQYTLKTEASLQPEAGEKKIFSDTLKMFQYMDSGTPKAFPSEPSPLCRMALFEKTISWTEGTGKRKAHRGFRLSVVTSPQTKTLSSVQHTLGHGAPIVFGYLRGENSSPALLLKLKEDSRPRSMVLTFDRIEQRTLMHSLLLGMLASENETTSPNLPLRSFSIAEASEPTTGKPGISHLKFNAGSVSIIDIDSSYLDHSFGNYVLSENLRALISTDWGTVTDRINLGPGEMKIGLDTNFETVFYMYRARQEDMTLAVAENLVEKELPDRLTHFLEAAKTKPTVRRYEFNSLQTLHSFQELMTGFKVVYDGMAASFAISRRRMVVPIHKKWEAAGVRLQLMIQNKTVQLVAFFGNDFSHGRCMNFVLRGTDNYESSSRSGKYTIRIVDAKFALPKRNDEEASGFVCLDLLDYATEHDDITIGFESEQDRGKFLASLPGSTREPMRMASLRR